MIRSYHIEIAAFVAEADRKWVDNLLSHFSMPGVESAKQGVTRRIGRRGLEHIALVRRLSRVLGVPLARAVELAVGLLGDPVGRLDVADGIQLRLDRAAFEVQVLARVEDAAERSTPARRGRRPTKASGAAANPDRAGEL